MSPRLDARRQALVLMGDGDAAGPSTRSDVEVNAAWHSSILSQVAVRARTERNAWIHDCQSANTTGKYLDSPCSEYWLRGYVYRLKATGIRKSRVLGMESSTGSFLNVSQLARIHNTDLEPTIVFSEQRW